MSRLLRRVVGWLGRPLEVRERWTGSFEALVVLGAPVLPDGQVSGVVAERLHVAIDLWRTGVAPLIVVTGGPTRPERPTEAAAMRGWAEAHGLPASAVVVEDAAMSTFENARNVREVMESLSGRRVLLITQPYHLRRARWWFRRFGFEAEAHRIADSVQDREPGRALKWILREYGAWLMEAIRSGARRR